MRVKSAKLLGGCGASDSLAVFGTNPTFSAMPCFDCIPPNMQ